MKKMEGEGSWIFLSNNNNSNENENDDVYIGLGYTYTMGVVVLIFTWQLLRRWSCFFRFFCSSFLPSTTPPPPPQPQPQPHPHHQQVVVVAPPKSSTSHASSSSSSSSLPQLLRISTIISDFDLKYLIHNLDAKLPDDEKWEDIVYNTNNLVSYTAKCCKPKDGPMKYLSVTVFENCSPCMLRDFYMDNDYRKLWDRTLVEHKQLQVDVGSGTEIGRTIKKFPLLTPREYLLAWRVWEGVNQSFYCFSKECEHPAAPRQKKYVRVSFFRSGWRIRKVPGRDACEIKMLHQEDAGLNVEMAKLIFVKGIWNYVCKMDNALRKYSVSNHIPLTSAVSAVTLIHKVPPGLDSTDDMASTSSAECYKGSGVCSEVTHDSRKRKLSRRHSSKLIANGLILLGGAFCLSRCHSDLGAKVAMAYIFSKFTKRGASATRNRQVSAS